MINFVIGVYGAPYTQQGASSAWQFANAVLKKNHRISQIFFFGDGSLNANQYASTTSDEIAWPLQWQQLAQAYHIPLFTCPHAAMRRGVQQNNLLTGFEFAGLSQFIGAINQADRYIIFR